MSAGKGTSVAIEAESTGADSEDLDTANRYIARRWRLLNRNVDRYFSNKSYKIDENKSSLFAYASFYKKEGQKIEQDYDFQLKFDLPSTTKRLKLVIEREQDEIRNALTDENLTAGKVRSSKGRGKGSKTVSKVTTGSNTKSSYTAGFDYFVKQTKSFSSILKFGIRLDMPVNPSVKLNLNKDLDLKFATLGLQQNFIVYRQEGFQEISQAVLSRKWTERFQTDFFNALVWTDESDQFALRNNILFFLNVGEEKMVTLSAGANARLSPNFRYESYDTSISYRQLLYNEWLYGAFTYGKDFPRANHFKDENFVQFRTEIFFK